MKMTWVWTGVEASEEDVLQGVLPGWRPMLRQLLADMEAAGWQGDLVQIKEKFGELRVYVEGNQAVQDLAWEATSKSIAICEECGEPGEERKMGGYFLTLCDQHFTGR